jgi:hypothetical protein
LFIVFIISDEDEDKEQDKDKDEDEDEEWKKPSPPRRDLHDLHAVAFIDHGGGKLAGKNCAQVQLHYHGLLSQSKVVEQAAHG